MFALAEKKMTIVTEAMSRGNQEDCQKYGKIVSEFADFFEIRREKKMALEQILDKYVYRDDVDHPSTPFEYNGRTIYIIDVDMNFDQSLHVPSGIRCRFRLGSGCVWLCPAHLPATVFAFSARTARVACGWLDS